MGEAPQSPGHAPEADKLFKDSQEIGVNAPVEAIIATPEPKIITPIETNEPAALE